MFSVFSQKPDEIEIKTRIFSKKKWYFAQFGTIFTILKV